MATKEYSYYPGCSSEKTASASNLSTATESICEVLDIKLNEIPDWNCCGASIGYAEGGELPRTAMNARNIALSQKFNPGQDMVATCAACWLGTKEGAERLSKSEQLLTDTQSVLAEAGLEVDISPETPNSIRHMIEILIEDFGFDALSTPVSKSLEGIKVAGYVGCQTNRPFGIDGESFENPKYLDTLVDRLGGESVGGYDQKVTCCGGALAFSEPDKSQAKIKDIIQSAYDHGAEIITTPCPVCQMNVEVYQGQINKKYGTKYNIPVVYYSQLMTVAYGGSVKQAGLDGQIIRSKKLEEIAKK